MTGHSALVHRHAGLPGNCCGSGAQHAREMVRVLGKYHEAHRWTPDPSRPMSETEQNWDRIGFGERPSPSAPTR